MNTSRARSERLRRGFSLVETLTVLVIMSILAVLGMSSFSSLRSTTLTSSGNQMVDVFAMARQNSISKNAYTAVVIKSQGTGAYSAYCLLQLTRQDDGSLGAWTAITPWRYLGRGVVFESGQTNDTFTSTSINLPALLPTAFNFQGQQINLTSTTVYQCYQPDGTLSAQPASPTRMVLRLIEGAVDPTSGAFTYQGTMVSGQEVSYYDLVFVGNTGMTKIERP
jgi:prepilin-type N-terminal cleavage/methylation domain-containing protein